MAARIEQSNPAWLVMWSPYFRRYYAYPRFSVPKGTPPQERAAVDSLRRALAGLEPQQALEMLLAKTRETVSNSEFLHQVQRSSAA
jgi:hypothetical protein